jgi:hypothetical protein
MTASAVLRVGSHAPVPLYGTPAVSPDYTPGEVTIRLGYDKPGNQGNPVILVITSLEWDEDLEGAARTAWAGGVCQAGMHLQVVR